MQLLRVVAKLSAFATSVLAAPIRIPGIPEAKLYGDDVSNQLTDGTPCRDLSVIYARGTTQSGNIGNSISVGPITFDALAKIVGQNRLAVQGVDYKASFMGYAKGGQPKATGEMVDLIQEVGLEKKKKEKKGPISRTADQYSPRLDVTNICRFLLGIIRHKLDVPAAG